MYKRLFALLFIAGLHAVQTVKAQSYVPTGNPNLSTLNYVNGRYFFQQNDQQFDPVYFLTSPGIPGSLANLDGNGNFLNYHSVNVNIDGQVNYSTMTCTSAVSGTNNCNTTSTSTPIYKTSSILILDQDGHMSLGGGAGGGIATDPATGNTCIPYNANAPGQCNVPTALNINVAGQVSSYFGQATAGTALGIKVWEGAALITGTWGANTIFATPISSTGYGSIPQQYQIMGYISTANANAGATCYVQILYTDDTGPTSQQSPNFDCAQVGHNYGYDFIFRAVPNSAVQLMTFTTNQNVQYNHSSKLILW